MQREEKESTYESSETTSDRIPDVPQGTFADKNDEEDDLDAYTTQEAAAK